MRKVLKWVGIIVGVLLVVIILAAIGLYFVGKNNLNKTYDNVQVQMVTIPTDDAALVRGEHIAVAISLCAECHGDDLGGEVFLNEDESIFGSGDAPNLTTGAGGVGADYTDEDWVRAIRHGIRPNGESLKFMPSQLYYEMSDDDLGAVIAYVKHVPPVDNDTGPVNLALLGTILMGNVMDLPAEQIDHDAARPVAPPAGVTVEYGAYLATIGSCIDCHGDNLDGDVPMGASSGPNLVKRADEWTGEQFVSTLRQGINPDGDALDPVEMPWNYYTRMTDDELSALWLYIESLE